MAYIKECSDSCCSAKLEKKLHSFHSGSDLSTAFKLTFFGDYILCSNFAKRANHFVEQTGIFAYAILSVGCIWSRSFLKVVRWTFEVRYGGNNMDCWSGH